MPRPTFVRCRDVLINLDKVADITRDNTTIIIAYIDGHDRKVSFFQQSAPQDARAQADADYKRTTEEFGALWNAIMSRTA